MGHFLDDNYIFYNEKKLFLDSILYVSLDLPLCFYVVLLWLDKSTDVINQNKNDDDDDRF
jgi:hypothetical protein